MCQGFALDSFTQIHGPQFKMKQLEIEKVYLVKQLPADLVRYKPLLIQVGDLCASNKVGALKIRQKGDRYELIKKENDSAHARTEHIIHLSRQEFERIWPVVERKHSKLRYFYSIGKLIVEIDFYLDLLNGYARAEVEFKNIKEMKQFKPLHWFGPEITQWNHEIHKNLGSIAWTDLKKRYIKKGIKIEPLFLPK